MVQIVSPADGAGPLSGPFTLVVGVDLRGSTSTLLAPDFSYGVNEVHIAPRTVTAEQCPAQCILTFEVDPSTWAAPLPSGFANLGVYWLSAEGSNSVYRGISYVAPVESVWISAVERDDTATVRGYHPAVMDTGGSLVISGNPERIPGEVLEARVYPGATYLPLPAPELTSTGVWDQSEQAPVARIRLETASLAAGSYRLLVRARDAEGRYGWSMESILTVRHLPLAEIGPLAPFLLAGSTLPVSVQVNRPLPDGVAPASVQVTIGSGPAQALSVPDWNIGADKLIPMQGSVVVPASALPVGLQTVTTQVLDARGLPVGAPATGQVRVFAFTEQASVPTLVVGQTSAVTFRGTAPTGMSYDACSFLLTERGFTIAGGGLCFSGDTSYTRSIPWRPQTAGPGEVELSVRTLQGIDSPVRVIPLTVHAHRTASISAVRSAYGTRPMATVTVRDLKNLFSPTVAASGLPVVLQRKAVGTSIWLTVGSGRTDSTGRALVAFTNTANGRLRAVVASSVPGKSVVTAERTVTCVSTVSWSSLSTSTRSGALTYVSVTARPYERGASVRVQARYLGGSSWITVGSASVSSTGAARAGFRLYTRGTWEVRVMRVATTLRATGYSTVRRIAVR